MIGGVPQTYDSLLSDYPNARRPWRLPDDGRAARTGAPWANSPTGASTTTRPACCT